MRILTAPRVALAAAIVAASATPFFLASSGTALAQNDASFAPYTVDAVHSSVVFRIKHAGVAFQYGKFSMPTGSYELDPATGNLRNLTIAIDANRVFTGNRDRDNHLRGADFFDVRTHPTIEFSLSNISNLRDNKGSGRGELTFLGQTRPIEFDYEFTGAGESRLGNKSGFHATFAINRSDFGMNYGIDNGALGDEVTLMVGIEGDAQ